MKVLESLENASASRSSSNHEIDILLTLSFNPLLLLTSLMNCAILVASGFGCSHNLRGITDGEAMIKKAKSQFWYNCQSDPWVERDNKNAITHIGLLPKDPTRSNRCLSVLPTEKRDKSTEARRAYSSVDHPLRSLGYGKRGSPIQIRKIYSRRVSYSEF